jgi:hypothetical protein
MKEKLAQLAEDLVDIPFNDFEMYHSSDHQGSVERGGTCIFLMNEFLRRLEKEFPEIAHTIIRAREFVHYAVILHTPEGDMFFDPFIRMPKPVAIPAEPGESEGFQCYPQDSVRRVDWELLNKTKRKKHFLQSLKHLHIEGDRDYSTALHSYLMPFCGIEPIDEFDLVLERKNSMSVEVFETINGVRRAFSLLRRVNYDRSPMVSFASNQGGGHPDHSPDVFVQNIEPIAARLGMTVGELLEYVEYAVEMREKFREFLFHGKLV